MRRNLQVFICAIIVCLASVVYIGRLVQLQLVQGDEFLEEAEESSNLFIKLDNARGEILDKDGNVLVGNTNIYNVAMNAVTMDSDRNPAILDTIRALEYMGEEWIDNLPIRVNGDSTYSFIEGEESAVEYLKGPNFLDINSSATAQECMELLIDKYNCEEYAPWDARDIISVRFNMTQLRFSLSDPYIIAQDVSQETVEVIREQSSDLPGVEIEVSTKRSYEDGTIAPHIIGAMGAITQEQYDKIAQEENLYSLDNLGGYLYQDTVGQSGVESYYEEYLRGERGLQTAVSDSSGNYIGVETVSPTVPGDNVYLTIDSGLQEVANYSLATAVSNAENEDFVAGAAVVLDLDTFGVLAAATYPSYDLEKYSSDIHYYNSLIEDEDRPLFNRAFNGTFTPGSVVKPATAITALEEGIIDEVFTVNCTGAYTYYETETIGCLGVHGDVNIYGAIQESCNVYFSEVGRITGIQRLEVYFNLFGLGTSTGLDLYENLGLMSNPTDYQIIHNEPWVDGVTSHAAIGQADNLFTPLQLATYAATIANDGVRYQTHVTDKITDYLGENVLYQHEAVVEEDIGLTQYNLDLIKESMRLVAAEGTASGTFGNYPIEIGAKTGTAETNKEGDNSLFIGFAPYDDPEIAVAVVLEYASSGTQVHKVVLDIFNEYFYDQVPW